MTVTTEDIMSEVERLRSLMDDDEIALTLAGVPDAVANREQERLSTFLATDDDDREAIDKWFSHYQDGNTTPSEVETDVIGEPDDPEYVVVRSEMYSQQKANRGGDGDGHYAAFWIVGEADDADPDDHFIHRVEWSRSLPELDELFEISREQVQRLLGFDADLPPADKPLAMETTYRAQGDLTLEIESYEESVRATARQRASNERRVMKKNRREEWFGETLGDIDGVRYSALRTRVRVTPDGTDELKELQERLDISEDEIRSGAPDGWDRLTAKRRKKRIQAILASRMNEVVDIPDKDTLAETEYDTLTSEHAETAHQQNIRIGNHLLIVGEGVQDGDRSVLVPEETMLSIIHLNEEHADIERPLQSCRLEADLLDRHERN